MHERAEHNMVTLLHVLSPESLPEPQSQGHVVRGLIRIYSAPFYPRNDREQRRHATVTRSRGTRSPWWESVASAEPGRFRETFCHGLYSRSRACNASGPF